MVDKDKQIEEMAVELGVYACKKTPCKNCAVDYNCTWLEQAIRLYNAGYRKASEVALEVIKKVEDYMHLFEDDDDGYLLKKCEFEFFMREIKNKYTEEVK